MGCLNLGQGTYDYCRVFVCQPNTGTFEELYPDCGDGLVNLRVESKRVDQYLLGNECAEAMYNPVSEALSLNKSRIEKSETRFAGLSLRISLLRRRAGLSRARCATSPQGNPGKLAG